MKATVTKENQEGKSIFYHVSAKDSKGNPVKCRRNGKTNTWHSRPLAFSVPVKHGLWHYDYINETNCKDWEVEI